MRASVLPSRGHASPTSFPRPRGQLRDFFLRAPPLCRISLLRSFCATETPLPLVIGLWSVAILSPPLRPIVRGPWRSPRPSCTTAIPSAAATDQVSYFIIFPRRSISMPSRSPIPPSTSCLAAAGIRDGVLGFCVYVLLLDVICTCVYFVYVVNDLGFCYGIRRLDMVGKLADRWEHGDALRKFLCAPWIVCLCWILLFFLMYTCFTCTTYI